MQNEKNDSPTYEIKIEKIIPRPAAEVYRAIGEGRLFLNCSASNETLKIDFRVGGKYHIDFISYGMTNQGEFLELVPNQKIVFTWCQDSKTNPVPDTTVTIIMKEQNGKTTVSVHHVGFKNQGAADDHTGGWNGGLDDLTAEICDGKLKIIRYYEISVETLYEQCKNPESFFGYIGDLKKGSLDFRVGGKFKIPNDQGEVTGEFIEIIPNEKIVFSWKSPNCGALDDTKVSLTFEIEEANDSWLTLIHEGLGSESAQKSHREAWDWILEQLRS